MPAAYLDICIGVEEAGVLFFQAECVAEISYDVNSRDNTVEWSIESMRFEEFVGRWKDMQYRMVKTAAVNASKDTFDFLLTHVDNDKIDEQLREYLCDTGELSAFSDANDMRADYYRRVL